MQPETLALLAELEERVVLERPEVAETRVILATRVEPEVPEELAKPALLVPEAQLDPMVLLVSLELLEQPAPRVIRAILAQPAHKDHPTQAELDLLEPPVGRATPATLEEQAEQVPRTRVKEVTLDHLAIQVQPAPLAELEHLVQLATRATREQPVVQVGQVARAELEQPVRRVILATLDRLILAQLAPLARLATSETRVTLEPPAEPVLLAPEDREVLLESRAKLDQLARLQALAERGKPAKLRKPAQRVELAQRVEPAPRELLATLVTLVTLVTQARTPILAQLGRMEHWVQVELETTAAPDPLEKVHQD